MLVVGPLPQAIPVRALEAASAERLSLTGSLLSAGFARHNGGPRQRAAPAIRPHASLPPGRGAGLRPL